METSLCGIMKNGVVNCAAEWLDVKMALPPSQNAQESHPNQTTAPSHVCSWNIGEENAARWSGSVKVSCVKFWANCLCMYGLKPFDDSFGRFRSIWNDTCFPFWTHLAFNLSCNKLVSNNVSKDGSFSNTSFSVFRPILTELHPQKSNIWGKNSSPISLFTYFYLKIIFVPFLKNLASHNYFWDRYSGRASQL